MEVTGTLIWYYYICKREVWLMFHQIAPDEHDTNIEIGRFLHENTYKRNKKEIQFGHVKFDVFMRDGDKVIIGETKKSSKFQTASKYQLLYYLSLLENMGINAQGMLLYPEEKKRVDVVLDDQSRGELKNTISEIQKIIAQEQAPPVEKNKLCRNCGYREYCYA